MWIILCRNSRKLFLNCMDSSRTRIRINCPFCLRELGMSLRICCGRHRACFRTNRWNSPLIWKKADSSNSKRLNRSRPRDFDYLSNCLHEDPVNLRTMLEEYRVDPQGRPIEPGVEDSRNPSSLGFNNQWLLSLLPARQSQSKFRYLGRQQIAGHGTFVVAFAQNPTNVQVPAEVRFRGERIPVFWQGVAWVEELTFRIIRLRSDLLDPISSIHLQQLTSQLQFDDANVSGLASPLWLPREVDITKIINGLWLAESTGTRTIGCMP